MTEPTQSLEIVVLGSGSCIPVKGRRQASLLVRAASDRVLLDCGNGAVINMVEEGTSPYTINHIVLTHLHPDHTSDLVTFMAAMNFEPLAPRTAPLYLYGPVGLGAFIEKLYEPWPYLRPESYVMHINESAGGTFAIGEIEAACRVMRHAEHSLGWRITFRGKSAAVSGDTAPNPGLIKLSRGADILICECSYPEGTRTEMHMTPSLAGQAAQEAGVKTLVLTHLYPATEATDVKGIAAERFEGEIIVAHDLLHLAL